MCVVIDLDAVCLICLQPSKEMKSVFTNDIDSSELQIAQKISILSELKIDQNKHTLPSKICVKCLQDLEAAWRFRKNCQAAVTIFQTIVSLEDVEQPQEEVNTSKDASEKQNKIPKEIHIKRVEKVIEKVDSPSNEIETHKRAPLEEYVIVSEKANSIYEELGSHEFECQKGEEEQDEFQPMDEEFTNRDMEENQEDENPLVEYYINDEGTSEELSIKLEEEFPSISTSTQTKNKKLNEEKNLKQTKLTELLTNINKPIQRGRPRNNSNKKADAGQALNRAQLENSKKVLCKIKEDVNSSNKETKTPQTTQVRQVKSRKRRALSPETKPPKICDICGNSYRFQHALNAHMRRHYNERPFPCEFCDKAFVSNVELRRHIRVHTGQKPYACQYCDRRFSDFGSRIKHERTHTGERPYVCSTCGKSFAYPHVLSVHLLTHTGEKRFRCDYCSTGFTKKVYLQRHIEQYHGDANNDGNVSDEATNSSQDKCILSTEYVNEDAMEDNTECKEEENQEDSKIITSSRIQFQLEDSNEGEDDNEESVHEVVEVHPYEYTIRVR